MGATGVCCVYSDISIRGKITAYASVVVVASGRKPLVRWESGLLPRVENERYGNAVYAEIVSLAKAIRRAPRDCKRLEAYTDINFLPSFIFDERMISYQDTVGPAIAELIEALKPFEFSCVHEVNRHHAYYREAHLRANQRRVIAEQLAAKKPFIPRKKDR